MGKMMLSVRSDDTKLYIEGLYEPSSLMMFKRLLSGEQQKLTEPKDLDLTGLVGSDSGLIAVLLAFQRVANEKGWSVCLINANAGIKGLITLGQLEDFFVLHDSQ
ncbi:hypothetical protein CBF23_001800 [Marinomonas agarivorans]|nr:hypothetical protein CBF23_001800 [Marinomonas agarivorans]